MPFPKLATKFLLAPMSGVTDIAFRILCRRYGAAMTYTEFCSAEGIIRENRGTLKQLRISSEEKLVGIQLFGNNIESLKRAAKIAQSKATVIDLNLGCPAWHVLNQGCGSALLANPEKIEELVREVTQELSIPFTVKLRLGISESRKNFIEIANRCVDAGAAAVTLHARTAKQGYSGKADWKSIKELKQTLTVPVIGNGDVFTPEDAINMLDKTGCDYVMIGRGARNNPFIFQQANELLENSFYNKGSNEQKLQLFNEYLRLATKYGIDFFRVKGHALSLSKGVEGAKVLRKSIAKTNSLHHLRRIMEAPIEIRR